VELRKAEFRGVKIAGDLRVLSARGKTFTVRNKRR
jgi:hypothetical protein